MAVTPVRLNALTIINGAFDLIQVKTPGEAVDAADSADALRRLNQMISGWATLPLTFPFIDREVFAVTANQGTYTIGPGGNFDTIRPTSLTGAGLLLNWASTNPVEIPRPIITDDAYQAIQIKDLTSSQWTQVYFNADYSGGLATVFLWPVPNTTVNKCVLYRGDQIQGFANLTTEYDYPPGYADALEYNLAARLLTPYSIKDPQVRADVKEGALTYLRMIKTDNFKASDLALDAAFTNDRRGGFNILTGTGS